MENYLKVVTFIDLMKKLTKSIFHFIWMFLKNVVRKWVTGPPSYTEMYGSADRMAATDMKQECVLRMLKNIEQPLKAADLIDYKKRRTEYHMGNMLQHPEIAK